MSKAEKFIQENTKVLKDSNGKEYFMWISPDKAREAVEIAREKKKKKGIEFLKDHLEGYDIFGSDIERSIESFKLAMKDE